MGIIPPRFLRKAPEKRYPYVKECQLERWLQPAGGVCFSALSAVEHAVGVMGFGRAPKGAASA